MLKLLVLAGSAVALLVAYTARRLNRRSDSADVTVPSVSEQWLAEQRAQGDDH